MAVPALFRVRLIPVTILAASLLAGAKMVDVWTGAEPLFAIAPAHAAAAASDTGSAAAASETAPAAATTAGTAAPASTQAPAKTPAQEKASPADAASQAPEPITYSKAEVEVLQGLAKRRDALNARARELDLRQAMLAATAKKVDAKIATLKVLEQKIQGLLHQRDAQDEKNMKSLVKVYENMKPQDAARIFEKLDMPILLDVAGRMREQKLAAILADMNPDKARSVTTELATWRATPLNSGGATAGAGTGGGGQNG